MIGIVMLQSAMINSKGALATRVRAHEYRKAIAYAATRRASDWSIMDSLSEILIWIEFDEVVMVLTTLPVDSSSSLLTGRAKSDRI